MSEKSPVDNQDIGKEGSGKAQEEEKIIELKESEHRKLLEEAVMYKDKHLRLYAEFENARKRMDRDRQEFIRYANEEVLSDLLNVLDSLELSLNSARQKHEDAQAMIKGLEMVIGQMYELLKKNHVKPIEAKGKLFDPHYHEVLMQEETDKFEDNVVMEEFQKGYTYHDRVLRTVKVKLAKAKS